MSKDFLNSVMSGTNNLSVKVIKHDSTTMCLKLKDNAVYTLVVSSLAAFASINLMM